MRNSLSEVRLLREILNQRLYNMAHFMINNWCRLVCMSTIALTAFSSCIKDDLDDCPPKATPVSKVSLQFNYTYNIKDADAFAAEVKSLNVYVFDENGKYFDTYIENSDKFETGHTMDISGLKNGKYTFVCLARDRQLMTRTSDDEMEFSFASLTPGVSTIDDLTEKMGTSNEEEQMENNKDFAALYTAQTAVDFKHLNEQGKEGNIVKGELSLMKCTKTYRIVLLPYENEQTEFSPDNFDVRIEGSAAWLDHKGDKVRNESITYLPYKQEHRGNYQGETTIEGKPVDQALVYDLSSSRMFERKSQEVIPYEGYNDKRIIITDLRDKENPRIIFNHSLPWFLALCGERANKNWDDQEYLDRQDHYVLTFYVPDKRDYNLNARVKVNGWVLNLQDASLGGSDKQTQNNNNPSFNQ